MSAITHCSPHNTPQHTTPPNVKLPNVQTDVVLRRTWSMNNSHMCTKREVLCVRVCMCAHIHSTLISTRHNTSSAKTDDQAGSECTTLYVTSFFPAGAGRVVYPWVQVSYGYAFSFFLFPSRTHLVHRPRTNRLSPFTQLLQAAQVRAAISKVAKTPSRRMSHRGFAR